MNQYLWIFAALTFKCCLYFNFHSGMIEHKPISTFPFYKDDSFSYSTSLVCTLVEIICCFKSMVHMVHIRVSYRQIVACGCIACTAIYSSIPKHMVYPVNQRLNNLKSASGVLYWISFKTSLMSIQTAREYILSSWVLSLSLYVVGDCEQRVNTNILFTS